MQPTTNQYKPYLVADSPRIQPRSDKAAYRRITASQSITAQQEEPANQRTTKARTFHTIAVRSCFSTNQRPSCHPWWRIQENTDRRAANQPANHSETTRQPTSSRKLTWRPTPELTTLSQCTRLGAVHKCDTASREPGHKYVPGRAILGKPKRINPPPRYLINHTRNICKIIVYIYIFIWIF